MIERKNIRWFCPECGRVDPRHPDTLAKDLPAMHNPVLNIGNYLDATRNFIACKGVRIPQVFSEETKGWQNECVN